RHPPGRRGNRPLAAIDAWRRSRLRSFTTPSHWCNRCLLACPGLRAAMSRPGDVSLAPLRTDMRQISGHGRRIGRRAFLAGVAALGASRAGVGCGLVAAQAPAALTPERLRPAVVSGVQSGDVGGDRGIVWSRTDRPARMIVEYATTESFKD